MTKKDNVLKKATRLSVSGYHKDIDDLKAKVVESKESTKRFNVEIPEEMHRKLKAKAAQEGLKLNELAMKLFNEYLSK